MLVTCPSWWLRPVPSYSSTPSPLPLPSSIPKCKQEQGILTDQGGTMLGMVKMRKGIRTDSMSLYRNKASFADQAPSPHVMVCPLLQQQIWTTPSPFDPRPPIWSPSTPGPTSPLLCPSQNVRCGRALNTGTACHWYAPICLVAVCGIPHVNL